MHWLMDITKEQLQDVIQIVKHGAAVGAFGYNMERSTTDYEIVEKLLNDEIDLYYICNNIDKQFPAICMAAVRQDGYALNCIKEQTPELCMAAVQQDGWALQFVKDQTPEICLAAVRQNDNTHRFIRSTELRASIRRGDKLADTTLLP
jgi:hypothetical protein